MIDVKRFKWNGRSDANGDAVLYVDYAALHSLLVKACVELANRNDVTPTRNIIAHIARDYGIRLRWTGSTFEEDTTK